MALNLWFALVPLKKRKNTSSQPLEVNINHKNDEDKNYSDKEHNEIREQNQEEKN